MVERRSARWERRAALESGTSRPCPPAVVRSPGPRLDLAWCVGLVGIGLVGACAGNEPPGPLLVGGYFTAPGHSSPPLLPTALPERAPSLAERLRDGTYLAVTPAIGPPEPRRAAPAPAAHAAPAAALELPAAARKLHVGGEPPWLPPPKPEPSPMAATIWPSPPKLIAVATVWPSPPKPIAVATVWPSPPRPVSEVGLAVIPAAAPIASAGASVRIDRAPAKPDLGADDAIRVSDLTVAQRALEGAAREALRADRPGEALALYEQVQTLSPNDRAASLGRAAALWRLGRRGEAVAVYRTLLEADPGDLSAKISLLGLIAEDAPGEALRGLGQLARQHPKDGRIAARSAMILARQDRFVQAIVELRRAVALDPSNPTYWANLGILLDRAGRTDQAIQHYRVALRLAIESGTSSVHLDAIGTRLEHLSTRRPS